MERELAKIKSTFLGVEDHGTLTFSLDLEYENGTGQGCGSYSFDVRGGKVPQIATAAIIRRILSVVGVEKWEDLPGKMVYALKPEHGALVRGLATGPFLKRKAGVIIFQDVFEEFKEAQTAADAKIR